MRIPLTKYGLPEVVLYPLVMLVVAIVYPIIAVKCFPDWARGTAWALVTFWLVELLLVALLFRVMDAFRVFDLVFVMTQGAPAGQTSVMQYFGYLKMFPEQQYGYGAAVSVVVFVIIAALSVLLVRTVGRRGLVE